MIFVDLAKRIPTETAASDPHRNREQCPVALTLAQSGEPGPNGPSVSEECLLDDETAYQATPISARDTCPSRE